MGRPAECDLSASVGMEGLGGAGRGVDTLV